MPAVINQQWLDNERGMFSVVMCPTMKITIIAQSDATA